MFTLQLLSLSRAAAKIFSHPDVVAEEPWYELSGSTHCCQKTLNGHLDGLLVVTLDLRLSRFFLPYACSF
ncbi:Glutamine synthetase [Corchorus olitorius]|uniref:Glutamine synthetase n=1 Tax=Corchorus olitorius TaxID=93759 RepID=A0A1R3I1L9_9ROSI|nr:Glutamine synthetase [Corchorus olitorius]